MNFLDLSGPLDILRMVIEISFVSYAVYKGIQLVRETRAMQLVKGIIFILVAAKLSQLVGLKIIYFILQSMIQLLGFGLIILFQPELRRGLEKLGSSGFQDILLRRNDEDRLKTIAAIETIVKACARFSQDYTGALIIIERIRRSAISSIPAPRWMPPFRKSCWGISLHPRPRFTTAP
jgi:diadenylate cyclase